MLGSASRINVTAETKGSLLCGGFVMGFVPLVSFGAPAKRGWATPRSIFRDLRLVDTLIDTLTLPRAVQGLLSSLIPYYPLPEIYLSFYLFLYSTQDLST